MLTKNLVVGASAGNITPVPGYFQAIRRVCDKYGVLLVLDEVMCGIGRTGKMHCWEWEGELLLMQLGPAIDAPHRCPPRHTNRW